MALYQIKLKSDISLTAAMSTLSPFVDVSSLPKSRGQMVDLTEEQYEEVKNLPNVELIQEDQPTNFVLLNTTQNSVYTKSKNETGIGLANQSISVTPSDCTNWGLYECTQLPDEDWGVNVGEDTTQPSYNYFTSGDSVLHSLGEHVDIIITDTQFPSNCPEFIDDDGNNRFVEFDWHTLTPYVRDVLNYSENLLTSEYLYETHEEIIARNTINSADFDHGLHVATTAAGKKFGFAKKANVYGIALPFDNSPGFISKIEFDSLFFYLRAFHATKPINPETGRKNPTIVNCSWGAQSLWKDFIFREAVRYNLGDVRYDDENPFPVTGWDEAALLWETGFSYSTLGPSYNATYDGYQQDCKEEGIVIVAAAGNENARISKSDNIHWNDFYLQVGRPHLIYHYVTRSSWSSSIAVGAMGNSRQRGKALFSNYGNGVDVFAPGEQILGSIMRVRSLDWGDGGTVVNYDETYGTDSDGNNYRLDFFNGTSMAAPQVVGTLACHASSHKKSRYTYYDAMNYINNTSAEDRVGTITNYYYRPVDDVSPDLPAGVNPYANVPPREGCCIHSMVLNKNISGDSQGVYDDAELFYANAYYDIYGEYRVQPYTIYEGFSGDLRITDATIDDIDKDVTLYSTNPYAMKTAPTTGNSDILPTWMYQINTPSNDTETVIQGMHFPPGSVDYLGTDTLYLQDLSDANIHRTFAIKEPPVDDILNYKHANQYYLADSNPRGLVCKTTRPDSGLTSHPTEGKRGHGAYTYPRGSKVFST